MEFGDWMVVQKSKRFWKGKGIEAVGSDKGGIAIDKGARSKLGSRFAALANLMFEIENNQGENKEGEMNINGKALDLEISRRL